jgi:hypothetical protein
MDAVLAWLRTAFQEQPAYWTGIVVWVLGFGIYVYGGVVHTRPRLNAFGCACWAEASC